MPVNSDPSALMSDPAVRALLEAGGVWLWDADLLTETTAYQPGFWEQYGHRPDEAAETFDFLRFVHSRDLREVTRAWRAHLDGETEIYKAEWRLRTAAGDWRWIQSRGQVIERDADGQPIRMVGAYTDITPLKQSQSGLSESSAELDAVFRSSRDGLAVVGLDLTVVRANVAAIALIQKFTGGALSEGKSILALPSVHEDRPVIRDIELVLAGNDQVPPRLVSGIGGSGWMESSYSPVRREDGEIIGAAVTLRDATERMRMEESRAQALRLESLGLLAGGIAHDFNNLLAAISGNIELALMSEIDSDSREGLEDAQQAARRASEMIAELLAFAGKSESVFSPVSLSALTAEMVRYARKIPGQRAQIFETLEAGLPEFEGDATQIRQLVLNIVANAIDATKEEGARIFVRTFAVDDPREVSRELLVSARPAASYVVLQVADDGPGMTEETVSRIFEPFFTTKDTGHGLGLASVLGTVRKHGGTLAVESSEGAGATFTVFFPAR